MSNDATVETTTPATEATTTETTQTAAPAPATTETAAPEVRAEVPAWHEKFPSKYLNNGEPDISKLVAGYEHLQNKLSSKGYAPAADVSEFDYTPKNYTPDAEQYEAFKAQALELGLNKTQFNALLERYDTEMAGVYLAPEAAETQMKQHWGKDYDNNLKAANRAFVEFSDDTIAADDPILNHPTVLKLLANMGAQLGEDQSPPPANVNRVGTGEDEIKAIMASPDYWNNQTKQKQVSAWYAKK